MKSILLFYSYYSLQKNAQHRICLNVALISGEFHVITRRAGADLKEECSVEDATLDKGTGLWTIKLENDERQFRCRVGAICSTGIFFIRRVEKLVRSNMVLKREIRGDGRLHQ